MLSFMYHNDQKEVWCPDYLRVYLAGPSFFYHTDSRGAEFFIAQKATSCQKDKSILHSKPRSAPQFLKDSLEWVVVKTTIGPRVPNNKRCNWDWRDGSAFTFRVPGSVPITHRVAHFHLLSPAPKNAASSSALHGPQTRCTYIYIYPGKRSYAQVKRSKSFPPSSPVLK